MSKMLDRAMSELATLPETDQDEIGQNLLAHIEKLRLLRRDIDQGVSSLDRGEAAPLDIEEFLRERHEQHGKG